MFNKINDINIISSNVFELIIYSIAPFSLKNGTLDSKKNIIAPIRA